MTTSKTCSRCGALLPEGLRGASTPCPRCLMELGFAEEHSEAGAPIATPAELAPHFPELEILELVGRGGMGAVYRARQKNLEREVALKILSVEASADPSFAERFTREARALAALSHANITAVFDFGHVGERYWLLLEYVDGANLRQILRSGKLAPREALAMVSQMCDALAYAHDHGIVHRDIKPENVLVDRKGRIKIADFGLAKILGRAPVAARLTRTDQAMGTLHYMAPEQIEHPLDVDHRADIFSLGVVFYELLTGELPLGRFAPPSQRVQVDVRLDEVVLKALAKQPDQRYQTAFAVKTDVDTIAADPGRARLASAVATGAAAPAATTARGGGTLKTLLTAVAVGAGCLLLLGCVSSVFFLFLSARRTGFDEPAHPPFFQDAGDEVPPPNPPPAPGHEPGTGTPEDARLTPPGEGATQAELDDYARQIVERAQRESDAPPASDAAGEER